MYVLGEWVGGGARLPLKVGRLVCCILRISHKTTPTKLVPKATAQCYGKRPEVAPPVVCYSLAGVRATRTPCELTIRKPSGSNLMLLGAFRAPLVSHRLCRMSPRRPTSPLPRLRRRPREESASSSRAPEARRTSRGWSPP